MTNYAAQLREVLPTLPETQIARLIAEAMLESDRQPYWFSINHNPGPPKNLPCPIDYDWVLKKRVGIKTLDRRRARQWIVDAILNGYEVAREGGRPLTHSLARVIRSAEFYHRPNKDDDDDIPF